MTSAKTVLITGGCGFIGSNFLKYILFQHPDDQFYCFDKLNYVSDHSTKFIEELLIKYKNLQFLKIDLSKEYNLLYSLIVEKETFTDIIHFAAESSVDNSFKDPLFFTHNNIFSLQNLLECVRLLQENKNKSINFVHISTDEVYGEQGDTLATESTILNPSNPYSATKAAGDLIINSYIYSFKLPIKIIRSNNVYGTNQYPEKIIPMILQNLKDNSPISIHGTGHNLRRYLFIDDFVRAVELVWEKGSSGEIYNVGSEEEISNIELVNLISKIKNQKAIIKFVKDRNFNDDRYAISYEKIKQLSWQPRVKLVQGLQEIINNQNVL